MGSAGDLIVEIDGVHVLDKVVNLPPTALLGFSGATGGLNDVHAVSGLDITY